MEIAKRRVQVADLYHAGKTQMEIAALVGVKQATVYRDLVALRKLWHQEAAREIGEWVDQELQFAREQRTSVLLQWRKTQNPRYGDLVLRWSERIARILGIDAPAKSEDWTDRDWQEYVREKGLNTDDVIAEAEQIIRQAKGGTPLYSTGDRPETEAR